MSRVDSTRIIFPLYENIGAWIVSVSRLIKKGLGYPGAKAASTEGGERVISDTGNKYLFFVSDLQRTEGTIRFLFDGEMYR